MRKIIFSFFTVAVLLASPVFAAGTYTIDPVHSTLGFSIKHMMVSNTTGQFDKYEGTIVYDPNDLANATVNVTIQADSIDTHMDQRDNHLRSPDFFDVAKNPTITFVSKQVTPSSITGDLTIKGITKEVSIPVEISGPVKSPSGDNVIGISGTFKINRQDYGISFNKTMDQGGLMVANDVTVNISVEAKQ